MRHSNGVALTVRAAVVWQQERPWGGPQRHPTGGRVYIRAQELVDRVHTWRLYIDVHGFKMCVDHLGSLSKLSDKQQQPTSAATAEAFSG